MTSTFGKWVNIIELKTIMILSYIQVYVNSTMVEICQNRTIQNIG